MKSYSKFYKLQRRTAFLLIFLVPWFLLKALHLSQLTFTESLTEFKSAPTAILTALLIVIGLYHGYMGLKVICTDYISCAKTRKIVIGAITTILALSAATGCISLIRIFTQG